MRFAGVCAVIALIALSGCSERAPALTLYRNSPLDRTMRIHWATFDVNEESSSSYNLNNCQMAARLLNANVSTRTAATGQARDPKFGFWCESGPYKRNGPVPSDFPEAYPTDVGL